MITKAQFCVLGTLCVLVNVLVLIFRYPECLLGGVCHVSYGFHTFMRLAFLWAPLLVLAVFALIAPRREK